jgi:outer membrane receptor protein involved in Fe transport
MLLALQAPIVLRSLQPNRQKRGTRTMTKPQRIPFRPTGLGAALAAAGLLAALPSAAQQAAPARSEDDSTQKIVITANKRAEKQREVAGTVSVLDGADLERRGARDQEDTLKLTPGVQINKGDPSDNVLTIRGIGTSSCAVCPASTQLTTGVYLEDVPLNEPSGKLTVPDFAPFDLDRIEVLRGPQGALYGSASMGGALRYLVARPNLNSFEGSALLGLSTVSNGDTGHVGFGVLNAPLSTGVAGLRVVVFDRKDGGYIDNLGTHKKNANDLTQRGGRLVLALKPTKAFDASVVLLTQKTEQGDTFSVAPDPGKLEINTPTASTRTSQFDFSSLTMNYDLGGMTLTSITGYWKKKLDDRPDVTPIIAAGVGLPPTTPVVTTNLRSGHASSQELRLASNPGGSLSYVVGLFTQDSKSESDQQQDLLAYYGFTYGSKGTGKGSERAVFFDGELALSPSWSVGLGGRQYKLKVSGDGSTVIDVPGVGTFPSSTNGAPREDSGFTPKATLKYKFGENLWYALLSKGFRFGGSNDNIAPPKPYKSDSVWNYETGVRLSPAKGVQLDLTAFYLDWKDAQLTYYDATLTPPQGVTGNVGKARSVGLEAALRYRVSAEFDIAAALSYTDAKTTAAFVSQPIPGSPPITRASGAPLPGTPKLQTALQVNYRFDGPLGSGGRLNATHTHVDKRAMDLYEFTTAPGYDTLDLGLNLSRDAWTLALALNNVFDKRGVLGASPNTPTTYKSYALQRPRSLNASLRYDF